jgi:hypothetical protein
MKATPCSGAVRCQQSATEQVQLLTQQHELVEHGAEGPAVVAAESGGGLEVRFQMQQPQQPDDFAVAWVSASGRRLDRIKPGRPASFGQTAP